MNKYILKINGINRATIHISYKNGSFYRLELKSGKLTHQAHVELMKIVPQTEEQILTAMKVKSAKLTYLSIETKKSLYTQFMEAYHLFYEKHNQITPIINAAGGASLKKIINALNKISDDEQEALAIWEILLNKWNDLEPFYRSQMDLKQINSNLNTILRQIKNGKNIGKKTADNVATDYRAKI